MTNGVELPEFYRKKAQLLNLKENADKKQLENIYHQKTEGTYLADVIFAANDGLITTFAVVAGSFGAHLPTHVILILGFANLLGDGLAMGFGNYLGSKSERDYQKGQREKEAWEIDHLRPIEVEEVRQIMAKKGFAGADLERTVAVITSNREAWLDLMMSEELGITTTAGGSPLRHGLATFLSFFTIGLVPLLPFLLKILPLPPEALSLTLTALTLFTVGALRSRLSPTPWLKGGLEMLTVGTLAATAAYFTGKLLEIWLRK
jgi:VIT1/CCC1 family predicted Fe2+/Mn2+ transporter